MRTVALRWIFTLRRECRTSGRHKANLFGWCSKREQYWPNWTMTQIANSLQVLERMAGTTRLELATSAVTGQRSNQLNYVPNLFVFNYLLLHSKLPQNSAAVNIVARVHCFNVIRLDLRLTTAKPTGR